MSTIKIGVKLQQYRNNKNMTQTDMAKMFNVSLSSYRHWEMDVTKPNKENLLKVLKITE